MRPPGQDPFAGKAESFDEHYGTVRGRVRLELVLERLKAALPPPPARLLDAGGGTGAFAIPLARAGYDVTLLDRSSDWLDRARAHAHEARVQLRLIDSPIETLGALRLTAFDGVLCHAVLMYLDEPSDGLRALRSVAREGAVLSLLEKNRDGIALRPGLQGDYSEARRLLSARDSVGRLGIQNHAYGLDEWRTMLEASDWRVGDWVGIRLFSDLAPEDLTPHTYATLVQLERAAGKIDPYRQVARLVHFVARATGPRSQDPRRRHRAPGPR